MLGSLALLIAAMSAGVDAGLEASVYACRSLSDDSQRLACYDAVLDARSAVETTLVDAAAEVARAATPDVPPSTTTAGVPGAADAGKDAEDRAAAEFGFEDHLKDAPKQLISTVTLTDRNAKGGLVVSLANGQVWQQTGGERLFLNPGDTIYLFRGAMSAFYLSTSATGRRYRVSRLR